MTAIRTRIFDRKMKGSIGNAKADGSDPAVYSSVGVASVLDAAPYAAQFAGTELIGEACMDWDIVTAGNATHAFTVPTGKYWRLLSAVVLVTADANPANRDVTVTTRTGADATIEAIVDGTSITANQVLHRTFLFDLAVNSSGNNEVKAAGTLSIDEPVTDGDDFTLGDLNIFVVTAFTAGVPNEVLIGANEAATKANLNLALSADSRTSPTSTTHSVSDRSYAELIKVMTAVDFTGGGANDDMVFTATEPGAGTAAAGGIPASGELAVFVEGTLTHANNVLDGSGTLGGTTSGVAAVPNPSTLAYPADGIVLEPTEDVAFSVAAGLAGDNFECFLTYLQYDSDPR